MPHRDPLPDSLDETVSALASLLAQGYLRWRNGRRLGPDSGRSEEAEALTEASGAFEQKRLAMSIT